MSDRACALHNGQDIGKARDIKNVHTILVEVDKLHRALCSHALLRFEQYAQTGRGQILELGAVQNQLLYPGQTVIHLGFERGDGGSIQPTDDLDGQGGLVKVFFNRYCAVFFCFYRRFDCSLVS